MRTLLNGWKKQKIEENEIRKYLEKLGFWDKLFTACVKKEDADSLVDDLEILSTKHKTSKELVEALKLENEKQKNLISEQIKLLELNKETINVKNRDISAAEDTITSLHVTINDLRETIRKCEEEKESLVSENNYLKSKASTKCANTKDIATMPASTEGKKDDLSRDASKPKKKEIPLKKLRVRDQTEYVTKFIKTIDLNDCLALKVRIIESVKNDAKKKVTVDNILNNKKLDITEETIQLFKTALTRRRTALKDWFEKYDNFIASL